MCLSQIKSSTTQSNRAPSVSPEHIQKQDPLCQASLTLPRKYTILGVGVSSTSYEAVVPLLMRFAKARRRAIIDFLPVDIIVRAADDNLFRDILNGFDLVCPDGQPVRWLLNYFHRLGLRDRVCGTTSMLRLCAAAAQNAIPIYLYGSTERTLSKLRERLLEYYPALRIAGMESPPFRALTATEDAGVVKRINDSGAGLLFIGLGAPKQEKFAWEHRSTIDAVQLCVGAAFDFIAGTKRRAPHWMQQTGLEWLFRLCCEPRRLAKRYIVGNARFAVVALRHLCAINSR